MTDPNQPPCGDYSVSYIAEKPRIDLHRERMRYEIATAAMQSLIASTAMSAQDIAKEAVRYADALIEEFKH